MTSRRSLCDSDAAPPARRCTPAVFEHERSATCVALGVDVALGVGRAEQDRFWSTLRAALEEAGCPEVSIHVC